MLAFGTFVGVGSFRSKFTASPAITTTTPAPVLVPIRHVPISQAGGGGTEQRFEVPTRGKAFGLVGALALTAALVNRVAFTQMLTPFQSRADIVAVVCGVSLLLYAAGTAEVSERSAEVEQSGVNLDFASSLTGLAETEARFVARAALGAVKNVTAVAVFVSGKCVAREGLFRWNDTSSIGSMYRGVAVRQAAEENEYKYFADLRVMPTREVEFGFLPEQCQAVVVVPVGRNGAVVFGADKVRPMTGVDFGWLTAICNRLGAQLELDGDGL